MKHYFLLFISMLGLKISFPYCMKRSWASGLLRFFPDGYAKRFQNQNTSGYNIAFLFSAGLLAIPTSPNLLSSGTNPDVK